MTVYTSTRLSDKSVIVIVSPTLIGLISKHRQSGCGANVTAISAIMTVGDGEKYLACPRCQSLVLDKR